MAVRLKNIATVKRFIAEGYVRPTLSCQFRRLDSDVEEAEEEVAATVTVATMVTVEVVAAVTVATTVTEAVAAAAVAEAIRRSLGAVSHHRAAAVRHRRRARVHSAAPLRRWRWWCP